MQGFPSRRAVTSGLLLGAFGLVKSFPAYAASITGAGANFPYPLYAQWAEDYAKATGRLINYQSVGSGVSLTQIKQGVITFGASDVPLTSEDLERSGLIQFPTALGAVVPVINIPGIDPGALTLDGPTLAKIYSGTIRNWNHPDIVNLNRESKLPATPISVLRRAEGAVTTLIFTSYLAKAGEWTSGVGPTSEWRAAGASVRGNNGIADSIARIPGSIGYVDHTFVKRLAFVKMVNGDGSKAVTPEARSFQAAATNADWESTQDFNISLLNGPGADAWPITGATYILLPKNPKNIGDAIEVLKFFAWAYSNGAAAAAKLNFPLMPEKVVGLVKKSWIKNLPYLQNLKDAATFGLAPH